MARRKNTAECREVLRKVFENETSPDGVDDPGGEPGSGQQLRAGGGATNRIAGSSAARSEPLLGSPHETEAGPVDRHDSIRSSAPGAGLGDRGAGLSGAVDRPGGDRFASNVSDYVDEPVVASVETPEIEVASSNEGPEGEAGQLTGEEGSGAAEESVVGQGERDDGGDIESEVVTVSSQADEVHPEVEQPASPADGDSLPVEARKGSFSRLREWILGDDSRGVFGKPVEVRASTLVIVGLSVAIVVGLLGLYLKIEPKEGRLAGRIIDDRVAAGADVSPVSSVPAAKDGAKPAVRTSANIPARGLAAIARPVWSRKGGQRPPVRNVAPATPAQPAAGFVVTAATRWLRVRDLMGKEECAKLLDHLKKLQKELKERGGCKDGSIACKELENRMKKRHGEDLYAVDIGPFASWSLAQQASAELKELTRRAPWVFRDKPDYFAESYPRKP
ncbi:MAG: hypothetical protein VX288_00495 [Planctomycetota bacterium]|nr:hypothetical protein [Planctomycetota bacterium]